MGCKFTWHPWVMFGHCRSIAVKNSASRIIGEIVKDLEQEPVSLLLVSGDESIYTRIGCSSVGRMIVAIFERGTRGDVTSDGFQTILVKPEDRESHATELLEIHENEPIRYARNISQMAVFLRTLGYLRRYSYRRAFRNKASRKNCRVCRCIH